MHPQEPQALSQSTGVLTTGGCCPVTARADTGTGFGTSRRLRSFRELERDHCEPEDFDGYYDGPPLPALLIVFEEHDAVAACFDEESQHMLEGSCRTSLLCRCSRSTMRTSASRQCVPLSDSCTSIGSFAN